MALIAKVQEQDLFPVEPPQRRMVDILVSDIDFEDVGPDPSPELIRDIKYNGVHTPVWVSDEGGRFRLIAGRRRVLSSIELDRETIPAIIQPKGYDWAGMISDHALRKDNPAAELRAIEALLAQMHSESDIARMTGMSVGTIRARLRLASLNADLRAAFDEGSISVSAAEAALKLSAEAQQELAAEFEETGLLTVKSIKDRRRVQRDASVDDLPLDAFDTVDVAFKKPENSAAPASLDQFIAMVEVSPDDPYGLAGIGMAMIDTHRYDDAREVFQRIFDLKEDSA